MSMIASAKTSIGEQVAVRVPATSANLGPGFDCIGFALELYNHCTVQRLDAAAGVVQINVVGAEADRVSTTRDNLLYQSFTRFYQAVGQPVPAVEMTINLGVPLARGLGSSATAIVAGLVAANHLAGVPLSQADVMMMAIAMEGHPDNVVPALLGGCRLAATTLEAGWAICEIDWHPNIVPIVAIPNFELSTQAARQVLPSQYSRADVVFNIAHLGLLLKALEHGNGDWLRVALQDRIHQPYRQSLIPGYDAVYGAALDSGAYGLVISGAGPTLLTLAPSASVAAVQAAIGQAWANLGIVATVQALPVDRQGTTADILQP